MTWLLRGITFAGLGFVVTYAAMLAREPAFELRWRPVQGFQRVAEADKPAEPVPWTTSLRALDQSRPWPELTEAMQEKIRTRTNGVGFEFPVLVPSQFMTDATALGLSGLRYEQLDHGYYVIFQSRDMEIMIMGTSIVHHPEGAEPAGVAADYVTPFQDPGPRPAGGRITFGHFGADYSITFDCKVTEPGLRRNCVSADRAKALIAALVSGTPAPLQLPTYEGS